MFRIGDDNFDFEVRLGQAHATYAEFVVFMLTGIALVQT